MIRPPPNFRRSPKPTRESTHSLFRTCSILNDSTNSILSDSNARAVYNKQGKKSAMNEAGGEEAMPDPGQMFASLFGGKAFEDWIGEISLGKVSSRACRRRRELTLAEQDVSKAFEMSTTEEEREEIKVSRYFPQIIKRD